jgi:hypothetical protein
VQGAENGFNEASTLSTASQNGFSQRRNHALQTTKLFDDCHDVFFAHHQ